MMKKIHFLLALCVTNLILFPHNSAAQSRDKAINEEDVAIAFYKTANAAPNIEKWIKASQLYQETPAARRPLILEREKNRIVQKYNAYAPGEDILIIRTRVSAKISETETVDGNIYQLTLRFTKAPDAFYFPYSYADNHFAVMPYSLQRAMEARIDKARYVFLKENISSNKSYLLLLKLRAKESVMDKPYKINGMDQWILKTEIGSIELWNETGTLLWENHANWYVAPQLEMMNSLYDPDAKPRAQLGTIKTFEE